MLKVSSSFFTGQSSYCSLRVHCSFAFDSFPLLRIAANARHIVENILNIALCIGQGQPGDVGPAGARGGKVLLLLSWSGIGELKKKRTELSSKRSMLFSQTQ